MLNAPAPRDSRVELDGASRRYPENLDMIPHPDSTSTREVYLGIESQLCILLRSSTRVDKDVYSVRGVT